MNALSIKTDAEDPIVREIPIYLSKRLEKNLYVFQYPLRPKCSQTDMNIRKCFFKPENDEIKLEMGINMESQNVDTVQAQAIAEEYNGTSDTRGQDKELIFENNIMDKIVLSSTQAVKDPSQFAIGSFNGREYHITPLKGFLQMRPCFAHTNKTKKRKNLETDSEEEEEKPSEAEAVTVKFARTENERIKKARENSYRTLQEKSAAEKWIPCTWHKADSTASEICKQKLMADSTSDISNVLNLPSDEYIKLLIPEDQEQSIMKPSLPCNVLSLHALRSLPLQEQCKLLLKDAKIVQFSQLQMLLTGGEGLTTDALLKALPYVAVLVRGNWIVKSDVLYPPKTLSAVSGVPADLMCRARDYVLLLFTKNQFVDRRKVSSVVAIPSEEIKEIFIGIARLRFQRGWELALPIDNDFISKHGDLVARQAALWEQRAIQLSDLCGAEGQQQRRQRRKSKSGSFSEEAMRVRKDSESTVTSAGDKPASTTAPTVNAAGINQKPNTS